MEKSCVYILEYIHVYNQVYTVYIYIYTHICPMFHDFSNTNTAIYLGRVRLQVPLLASHRDFNHAEAPGSLLAMHREISHGCDLQNEKMMMKRRKDGLGKDVTCQIWQSYLKRWWRMVLGPKWSIYLRTTWNCCKEHGVKYVKSAWAVRSACQRLRYLRKRRDSKWKTPWMDSDSKLYMPVEVKILMP